MAMKIYGANSDKKLPAREIEFRGKVIGHGTMEGQYVYGDYITPWAIDQINPRIRTHTDYEADKDGHVSAQCGQWEVDAKSVSQLVGTDKNGVKVYEGDGVYNPVDGTVFKAAMNHIYTIKNYILLEKKEKPTPHYAPLL